MEFKNIDLNDILQFNLKTLGYSELTDVQVQSIPSALLGKDLLVLSPTGTGKTGAYAIPLLNLLFSSKSSGLILVPTRDLAIQVYQFILNLTKNTTLAPVLLIGGVSPDLQLKSLKFQSRLIIGTPGRILYFSKLNLIPSVDFLVLDEVDRMLDLGFKKDIELIVNSFTIKPQTLLFSATLPKSLVPLTKLYLKDPLTLDLSTPDRIASTIKEQFHYPISKIQKQNILLSILNSILGTKIIFTNRKCDTESLSKFLLSHNIKNYAFNGNLSHSKRISILKRFLKGQFEILVCTDLASRGLDVKNLNCVINYELPVCAHDYMHRVGRTGRNGASGLAINLIGPQDQSAWSLIERFKKTNESSEYVKKDSINSFNNTKKYYHNRKTYPDKKYFSKPYKK